MVATLGELGMPKYSVSKTYSLAKRVRGNLVYITDFTCTSFSGDIRKALQLTQRDAKKLLAQAVEHFGNQELKVTSLVSAAPRVANPLERQLMRESKEKTKERLIQAKKAKEARAPYAPIKPEKDWKDTLKDPQERTEPPKDLKIDNMPAPPCSCGICRECLDRIDDLKSKGYVFR
jgi:hypothetical protein